MSYWQDKDDDKINLVVVTDEAVYAEKLDAAACTRQIEELNAGKSPATLFGSDATHVVLRSVIKVQQSSDEDDIDFTVRHGKDEKTTCVSIVDGGVRSEVLAALERVTQGRFKLYVDQYTRARAAFATALALTIFGLGTMILASAAAALSSVDEYEIDGRIKGLKYLIIWVLNLLGTTGVWVIGGTICAVLIWGLFNKVKSPPLLRILQAEPYKPQSTTITVLKYLALAVVWVVLFPVPSR